MKLLGLELRRAKAAPGPALQSVTSRGGGWMRLFGIIRERYTGAWQKNDLVHVENVLAHNAVFSCITLIAQDVGKLMPRLMEQDADGIWTPTKSSAFGPVLRKPNHFQNHIQFKEWWVTCKLIHGNTYALIERDDRGVPRRLYLLEPTRVEPLVSPDGSVFYRLSTDNLSGIEEDTITVPAREIIHDRMNCLFHPLVGISPIFAAGLSANVGLELLRNSEQFFGNGSNPSGILTAAGDIDPATAKEMSERWNAQFSGDNAGKVAVLGAGLKFEALRMTAVDSQVVGHLKWTAEIVCTVFHVPPFKVHVGAPPSTQNAELLNSIYYSDCLQSHIESMEACLDEGLGLSEPVGNPVRQLGVELDLRGLLRMDTAAQYDTLGKGVGAGILSPNEARAELNLKPVKGGESPVLQQQNWSLEGLARFNEQQLKAQANPPAAEVPQTTPAQESGKTMAPTFEQSMAGYWGQVSEEVERAMAIDDLIAGREAERLLRGFAMVSDD